MTYLYHKYDYLDSCKWYPPIQYVSTFLSMAQLMNQSTTVIHELPTKSYVCGCQTVILNMKLTLDIYKNGNKQICDNMLTDGMGCQQFALQYLTIIFLKKNSFKEILISTLIISKDKTSKPHINLVIEKNDEGGRLILQWRELTDSIFHDFIHEIHDITEINIEKLA